MRHVFGSRSAIALCAFAAAATLAVHAGMKKEAPLGGSIPVEGKHTNADLQKMAKITVDKADSIALDAVEGPATAKKVSKHELEVEGGCLVYSVEVKVEGKKGIREVLVDAGDGRVLGTEEERR